MFFVFNGGIFGQWIGSMYPQILSTKVPVLVLYRPYWVLISVKL